MKFLIYSIHKPCVVTDEEGKDHNTKVNDYMTRKFYTVNWKVVRRKQLPYVLLVSYTVHTRNAATVEVVKLLKTINSGNCEERERKKDSLMDIVERHTDFRDMCYICES
jgi:hypothetical protein